MVHSACKPPWCYPQSFSEPLTKLFVAVLYMPNCNQPMYASHVSFQPSNTSVSAQFLEGSPAHVLVLDRLAELSCGCCSF